MLTKECIETYSEDFSDLQPSGTEQKLHELPRGSIFKITIPSSNREFLKLHMVDGACSVCEFLDILGGVVHLSASTPVMQWVKVLKANSEDGTKV
jgi:hypothetical protein